MTEEMKAANAYWKSEEMNHRAGAIAFDAFLAGAAWQREQIRAEIIEWLDCTGVIPKGTSYYSELLGCVESSSSDVVAQNSSPMDTRGQAQSECVNCQRGRMEFGEPHFKCKACVKASAQNENARKWVKAGEVSDLRGNKTETYSQDDNNG